MAAFWAILLHVRPDIIAITGGYGGCHEAIKIYRRTRGEDEVQLIQLDDEYPHGKKLLVWVETPLNPLGTSRSLDKCASSPFDPSPRASERDADSVLPADAKRAHAAGGILGVDSTFGPPPLQDPFKWGVDIAMRASSFLSLSLPALERPGDPVPLFFSSRQRHEIPQRSQRPARRDRECARQGRLAQAVRPARTSPPRSLLDPDAASRSCSWNDRTFTGANIGSLDVWLLLRSLRTLDVRVKRQSKTATRLAQWLATQVGAGVVGKVFHTALQDDADELLGPGKQMELGPACFSVVLKTKDMASRLPNKLKLFIVRPRSLSSFSSSSFCIVTDSSSALSQHATSLGGVESLIEHRIISDPSENPCLGASSSSPSPRTSPPDSSCRLAVRLSIGLEDFDDLRADWEQAMKAMSRCARTPSSSSTRRACADSPRFPQ